MNFEEYLLSKKIDSQAFSKAEPDLFHRWKEEFEQMHPGSFTIQKLNLINPIRRKYRAKDVTPEVPLPASPAKAGKPVMKPNPKIN